MFWGCHHIVSGHKIIRIPNFVQSDTRAYGLKCIYGSILPNRGSEKEKCRTSESRGEEAVKIFVREITTWCLRGYTFCQECFKTSFSLFWAEMKRCCRKWETLLSVIFGDQRMKSRSLSCVSGLRVRTSGHHSWVGVCNSVWWFHAGFA